MLGFRMAQWMKTVASIDGDTVNAAAHLVGLALPGRVLTNLPAQSGLSHSWQVTTRDISATLTNGRPSGMNVFEVVSSESALPVERGVAISAQHCAPLNLRYMGKVIVLDKDNPVVRMGRDAESDVLVRDRRASRHHALIELRNDRIFLMNNGTNGTFVTLTDKPELFLRREMSALWQRHNLFRSLCIRQGGGLCGI